mgnify:CR=1 FL=1
MAKVVKINKNNSLKNSGRNISEVEMDVSFSSDNSMVILETFGSASRKCQGKASQVIHLNKAMALELVNILKEWK